MGSRDSYSNHMTCTLRGDGAAAAAIGAAHSFSEINDLSDDDRARLCIIVEELVTNLYDHGGLTASDEIELALAGEPRCVRVTLIDPGKPFDLRSARPASPNPGRGGGAGIAIVQAWTDIVSYESSAERNRLELLLRLAD